MSNCSFKKKKYVFEIFVSLYFHVKIKNIWNIILYIFKKIVFYPFGSEIFMGSNIEGVVLKDFAPMIIASNDPFY